MGYTGIRDKAGTWDEDYVRRHDFRILDKYTPKEKDHYALPFEAAPEFTRTSFHDLNEAHLKTKIEQLRAANDNMREALTPSASTKAAYIGEFSFDVEDRDENGDECWRNVVVPWTTVKEIMAAISARAGLKEAA
ncbi:hypothetical protein KNLIENLN_00096 [Sinorhizobium phage NV1.1.1]|nr:hypothetical protein KNLIENLN_00096 [Sinorhizobium phage NV1.1.1]